jgi:uncharacterized protein (UPF0332 family)
VTISVELLATAHKLLEGEPTASDVRKAISSAYYAVFHRLCLLCCESFAGERDGSFVRAKRQAYRSIDHASARLACLEAKLEANGYPEPIRDFSEIFVELQQLRHDADYDPDAIFVKSDALDAIRLAKYGIARLETAPVLHQKAFVILVALRKRPRG